MMTYMDVGPTHHTRCSQLQICMQLGPLLTISGRRLANIPVTDSNAQPIDA